MSAVSPSLAMMSAELRELRVRLREFDLSEVITLLGESDVLECIGVKRQLDYIQKIGFGPVGAERRFVRERVGELAVSFECDTQFDALERLLDMLHMNEEERLDARARAMDMRLEIMRRCIAIPGDDGC
jgi:hypothetical protein